MISGDSLTVEQDPQGQSGGANPTSPLQFDKREFEVLPIIGDDIKPWILKKHYAHRMPPVSFAFGLYRHKNLVGVCTFGMPASNSLCEGLCGKENKSFVLELNRLCLNDGIKNGASFLVSKAIRFLPKPKILVSYADTAKSHHGYIYQATNWLYTGLSADRGFDWGKNDGKHSRHAIVGGEGYEKVARSRKHRYVYFVGDRGWCLKMRRLLNYKIAPYPKGDNQRYDASYTPEVQQVLF